MTETIHHPIDSPRPGANDGIVTERRRRDAVMVYIVVTVLTCCLRKKVVLPCGHKEPARRAQSL